MAQSSSSDGGAGAGADQLMCAAAFNFTGEPEVLQPCLWSKPAAAQGRVLVRVGELPQGGGRRRCVHRCPRRPATCVALSQALACTNSTCCSGGRRQPSGRKNSGRHAVPMALCSAATMHAGGAPPLRVACCPRQAMHFAFDQVVLPSPVLSRCLLRLPAATLHPHYGVPCPAMPAGTYWPLSYITRLPKVRCLPGVQFAKQHSSSRAVASISQVAALKSSQVAHCCPPLLQVPGGDLAGVVEQAGPHSRFKQVCWAETRAGIAQHSRRVGSYASWFVEERLLCLLCMSPSPARHPPPPCRMNPPSTAVTLRAPLQGDRVFALVQYRPFVHNGAYAEYASVPEGQLAHMPGEAPAACKLPPTNWCRMWLPGWPVAPACSCLLLCAPACGRPLGWESHPPPLILATVARCPPLISHGIYINAEGLSFEEAAGVPLVSLTVWQVRGSIQLEEIAGHTSAWRLPNRWPTL